MVARRSAAIILFLLAPLAGEAKAMQSLSGGLSSVSRMYEGAVMEDFTFLETESDVKRFINLELLVPLVGNRDYELHGVSYPVARPAVRTFVERLASQYRAACGEKLVVTSLTRPINKQPRNASPISVHPAGMAVDLRLPKKAKCLRWLESTLLSLERRGLIEATRERWPAHLHAAVFPTQYLAYVERRTGTRLASSTVEDDGRYKVRPGDNLWTIARAHDTTVDSIRKKNASIEQTTIYPGQVLIIPGN